MPTARFSQAARENEKTTPTVSSDSSSSFVDEPEAQQARRDGLLHQDQNGRDEKRPEDVRILEQALRAGTVDERGGAREGRDERETGDGGRQRGADQVGEQDQARTPDRADVGGRTRGRTRRGRA